MILYLDTSALVKRYVAERGTAEVRQLIASAQAVGTSVVARAEMPAALAKAVRTGTVAAAAGDAALEAFRAEWPTLVRVQATEALIARADAEAWQHQLRGYDAVHLASALVWQEGLGREVTFATYDVALWEAAARTGLVSFPQDLTMRRRTGRDMPSE